MEMKWELRVLCFKSSNYQEVLQTPLVSIIISSKQHIQTPANLLRSAQAKRASSQKSFLIAEKLKFRGPCSLSKGKIILIYGNHSTSHFKKILKRVSRAMFDTILFIFNFSGKIEPFPSAIFITTVVVSVCVYVYTHTHKFVLLVSWF